MTEKADKKVSAAQRKATEKYLEKFDEIKLRTPKGKKEAIKARADSTGESVNSYLNRLIDDDLKVQ